jgi:hypothetical protein
MANVCMLLGKSGTGKSSSIAKLKPEETIVFNTLKKRLPFKGSSSMYNTEQKNMFYLDDYQKVINYLNEINTKAKNVKNIIIDDMIYIMRHEFFKRAKESGYGKFTELAQHFQQIIVTCENMRDDINIFFVLHSEDIQSDKITTGYKVSTVGNLIDSQYNPLEVVPVVLYSSVKYDEKGNAEYGFYTHRTKEGSVEIPAKSPAGMFEDDFIPNDLSYVITKMNEYYN